MSLVSAGTERMLVEFGKANWIDKARQQPDKVRMVQEGVRPGSELLASHTICAWRKRNNPGPVIELML